MFRGNTMGSGESTKRLTVERSEDEEIAGIVTVSPCFCNNSSDLFSSWTRAISNHESLFRFNFPYNKTKLKAISLSAPPHENTCWRARPIIIIVSEQKLFTYPVKSYINYSDALINNLSKTIRIYLVEAASQQ